jgi:hypothetical protein
MFTPISKQSGDTASWHRPGVCLCVAFPFLCSMYIGLVFGERLACDKWPCYAAQATGITSGKERLGRLYETCHAPLPFYYIHTVQTVPPRMTLYCTPQLWKYWQYIPMYHVSCLAHMICATIPGRGHHVRKMFCCFCKHGAIPKTRVGDDAPTLLNTASLLSTHSTLEPHRPYTDVIFRPES